MPKCLFFQDLEGLTEVFGRMSGGGCGPKLTLWADFSFLISELKTPLMYTFRELGSYILRDTLEP